MTNGYRASFWMVKSSGTTQWYNTVSVLTNTLLCTVNDKYYAFYYHKNQVEKKEPWVGEGKA